MIRYIWLGVFVAALGFWIDEPRASAEPIVFIVSYHNLDYAKEACRRVLSEPEAAKTIREPADSLKKAVAECKKVSDPRELGRRLENDLTDALAAEPLCAGVTVIRDPHPDFDKVKDDVQANYDLRQKKPYWDLHLDYEPGNKFFGWTLFPNEAGMKRAGPLVNGAGNAATAASLICTVITRRDAIIR